MIILHWNAINPATGQPFTYGDPNLRWGSPSYALTEGDYGWQAPPGHLPTTKTKKQNMTHQRYYPTRQGDQVLWLENFRTKINTYATVVGLSPATVLEIIADCRWLIYVLGSWLPAIRVLGPASTSALRQVQSGTGGIMVLPGFTAPPLPPAEPASVPPLPAVVPRAEGALTRLFDVIQEIKEHNGCTAAMCDQLDIIGPTEGAPDPATLRPAITATRSGNTVKIGWGWGGMAKFLDACQILVDRGNGIYIPLVTDTTPGYTDSFPQPATEAIWKYKAIYCIDDQQAGQWSIEVSVVVGG